MGISPRLNRVETQNGSCLYQETDPLSLSFRKQVSLEPPFQLEEVTVKTVTEVAKEAIGKTKELSLDLLSSQSELGHDQLEMAAQMAKELGYLPQAIPPMIKYIQEENSSFSAYHALFNEHEAKLFQEKSILVSPEESSILTTWSINIERRKTQVGGQLDRGLLSRISCLGEGPIRFSLLQEWMSLFSYQITDLMITRSLERLAAYSLITLKQSSEKEAPYYVISPRIQHCIKHGLTSNEEQEYLSELISLVEKKLIAFKEKNVERRSFLIGYEAHALSSMKSRAFQEEFSLERKSAFTINLSHLYYKLSLYDHALNYAQEGLKMRQELYGEYADLTAESYQAIGQILKNLWKLEESLKMSERALLIYQKIYGEDSIQAAGVYQDMWKSLKNLGRFEEALKIGEKALHIHQNELEETYHTVDTYLQMGKSLSNFSRWEEALKMGEKALHISQKIGGEETRYTAGCYEFIGTILNVLGKKEEALKIGEKGLEINQKIVGEYSHYTAESYETVGSILGSLGRFEEALEMCEKSLRIKKKVLGENSCITAESYEAVGEALNHLGRREEGLKMCQIALQIKQQLLGEYSLYTALSYDSIGLILIALGRREEGIKMFEKVVQIYQKVLGKDSKQALERYQHLEKMRRWSWVIRGLAFIADGLQSLGERLDKKSH
ncbi:tetratricopeptide repeat protein [Rhabdochlamydiaceae symbiont of Dictyostelium giganteum]|uniref:tetratricopeptide repeat protein n=1 Tax=Rhabdochlamydiaceae symbiont of Dictyostelium giganteum TaxID=3342349 RepID=UPI0038507BDD